MALDGPMSGRLSLAFVEQILVLTLGPGDVVIFANLPAHKGTAVRHALDAAGARLLFLPRYAPDFNPIENAFAKIKALLRTAGARMIDDLWRVIGDRLDVFSPAESANFSTVTV